MDGDNYVGFIQLYPSFSTVSLKRQWILNDLYVKEEYRNKGYAKETVSEIVAYYRTLSKATLHTEVYPFNRASLVVLVSCGFQITGSKDNKILLTL